MEEKKEKALLVGLNITSTARKIDDIDINESMEELKELAKAAGAEVVGSLIQNRQSRDAAFYVGKGKVEEIKAYSDSLGATVVIFNDELSGAHIRNIEEAKEATNLVASLDSENEEEINLYNTLGYTEQAYNEEILDLKIELENLNDFERNLIIKRYGQGLTQTEVSKELGINQVKVSREEKQILTRLRTRLK